MLDDYSNGQSLAVSIFQNAINDNKLSHAYLIDVNNCSYAYDFILSFVKSIVCSDLNDHEKADVCKRIDNGNYTELKIIEADGNWIKKNQIIDLQDSFSLKGVESNKRIYIIKDCDKMNLQTSNSILKFLEEPVENVIAILLTNNISSLLDTIVSRCQLIRLNDDNCNKSRLNDLLISFNNINNINKLSEDFFTEFISFVIEFENNGINILIDLKKVWYNIFESRAIIDFVLDLWIYLYYDILLLLSGNEINYFVDYKKDLIMIRNYNNYCSIIKKLEVLIDAKSSIKYNLNQNLFIDKLIMDMVGE